ncbi:hypothetical protein BJ742DRAFT_810009 [Cladochytrium replicatum]|nr:hypothetical protein BJ742DRAFT_810009 [Cladochytrium replicatum]
MLALTFGARRTALPVAPYSSFVRSFSSTNASLFPRVKARPAPHYQPPSESDLRELPQPLIKPLGQLPDHKVERAKALSAEKAAKSSVEEPRKSWRQFAFRPPKPQRHITDTQTAIPLPTTFRPKDTTEVKAEPRYYEITLRRGVVGLPWKTRRVVESLGFKKRHQVVYKPIEASVAGRILGVKELVSLRLVADIPPRYEIPKGYKKVGSLISSGI